MSVEEIHKLTHIDPWFLHQMRELIETEDKLRRSRRWKPAPPGLLLKAKQHGFSDPQLAQIWNCHDTEVRRHRKNLGIEAVFKLVDTCAAEFEAYTPYYYSTYESPVSVVALADGGAAGQETRGQGDKGTRRLGDRETRRMCSLPVPLLLSPCPPMAEDETRPATGKQRIMILGGGPNRIGQGIEFDYCCCRPRSRFATPDSKPSWSTRIRKPFRPITTPAIIFLRAADHRGCAEHLRSRCNPRA